MSYINNTQNYEDGQATAESTTSNTL